MGAVTYHCLGVATQCKGHSSRPNVLFIAVDDLNDWIGCLQGHPQALTPNIDRLAHSGVLFSNAHCAAPACTPSRAAVFSGQMPTRTGVWANGFPKLSSLRPNLQQLPTAFKQAGYVTLGTGKLSGDKKTEYDYSTPRNSVGVRLPVTQWTIQTPNCHPRVPAIPRTGSTMLEEKSGFCR